MSKWKATLPKGLPPKGKAQIIVGIKTDNGFRMEYSGEVDEQVAVNVFGKLPEFTDINFKKDT